MKNNDAYDSLLYRHKLRNKALTMFGIFSTFTILFIILAICCFFSEYKHEFSICLSIFFIFAFIFVILTCIYDVKERNYKLPAIDDTETLYNYLSYFLKNDVSDFNYALTLLWISKLIADAIEYSKTNQDEDFKIQIYKLDKITRPIGSSNGFCFASYRRDAFRNLVQKIIDRNDNPSDYERFNQEPPTTDLSDKMFILSNLSIIVFIAIIIIHIFAIIVYFLWEPSDSQTKSTFIEIMHEVATIIPSDVLMLLIYLGLVKETRNEKN